MVGCPKSLPLVEVGCLQLGITIREEGLLSSRFPTISILKKPETRGYFRLFRNLSCLYAALSHSVVADCHKLLSAYVPQRQ
jgi:hypothetical protein